jgi:putative FmdB family regulatory protein
MPTYEYLCDACGNQFERFQSITAAPIKKCPKCGKNKVRRLIGTGAGLIFKGSGFYITDYRDQGYKEKAKSETGGGEASGTKTETKSDTKAADAGKPAKSGASTQPAAKSESTKSAKPSKKT